MTKPQAEKRECAGCDRVVAMIPGTRSQKRRVRHKCPHGEWCVFGHRLMGNQGVNWPKCSACYADRKADGQLRTHPWFPLVQWFKRENARRLAMVADGTAPIDWQHGSHVLWSDITFQARELGLEFDAVGLRVWWHEPEVEREKARHATAVVKARARRCGRSYYSRKPADVGQRVCNRPNGHGGLCRNQAVDSI